jgi:ABC-2 type transport system permease protein
MGTICTVAVKDLRLLLRDRMGLFWVLIFPLLIAILFGAMFRGQNTTTVRPLPVLIVDEDASTLSKQFIEMLKKSPALELHPATRGEAQEALRTQKAAAWIAVPKGFQSRAGFGSNEPLVFDIGIDPARRSEAGILQGLSLEAFGRLQRARMADAKTFQDTVQSLDMALRFNDELPDAQREVGTKFIGELDTFLDKVDPKLYERALTRQSASVNVVAMDSRGAPANSFEITFPSGMIWGLIGCVATFSLSLVRERLSGTYVRLRIAPVSTHSVLAGKALACLIMSVLALAILTLIGVLAFHVRLQNPVGYALAVFCSAACFTGLMMLISALGTTEQSVAGAGWAILMVFAMFGGAMMPLYFMPDWMQRVGAASPVRWAIVALEGALWRSFSLNELAPYCVLLVAGGALAFVVGAILARRQAYAA